MRRELNRIEKATITGVPTAVRESLEKSLSFLKAEKARLEKAIRDHIDQHPTLRQDRHLLESIPAVGPKTAWRMVALFHARSFTRAPQAAADVGLPIQHQSGTSVLKRPRLSKAGDARLRAAFYMAAVVATQYNPDIRRLYQRLLAKGKTKMSALGAAMRKLVHLWGAQTSKAVHPSMRMKKCLQTKTVSIFLVDRRTPKGRQCQSRT